MFKFLGFFRRTFSRSAALLAVTLLASAANAQNESFTLSLACCGGQYNIHNSEQDIDLEDTTQLVLRGRLAFGDNWGMELALSGFDELEAETRRDNAGDYYLEFTNRQLMLGLFARFQPWDKWRLSTSVGALRYKTEVTLHESYFDLRPALSETQDEDGTGYYANLAFQWQASERFAIGPELFYFYQKELFSDSSQPLDLSSSGVHLNLSLGF